MRIGGACLLGGTGFVGRAVAAELARRGLRLRVPTRSERKAAPLKVLPTVELPVADVHDERTLERLFSGMDAVVNLVGILHERRGQTFAAAHAELPGKVARACAAAGVRHLVHVSAIGAAEDAPSEYLRSKARGERALREASGPVRWTILRPSIVFGEGDAFLNLFARMALLAPVIPLARAHARFQPIWVEDVARCVAAALGNPACFGRTFEIAGPEVLRFDDIVRFATRTAGHPRPVLALPDALGTLQAMVLERLPGKLMTRDNLRSLGVDNVSAGPFPEVFGFRPSPLAAVVPGYLGPAAQHSRYANYRGAAGR